MDPMAVLTSNNNNHNQSIQDKYERCRLKAVEEGTEVEAALTEPFMQARLRLIHLQMVTSHLQAQNTVQPQYNRHHIGIQITNRFLHQKHQYINLFHRPNQNLILVTEERHSNNHR